MSEFAEISGDSSGNLEICLFTVKIKSEICLYIVKETKANS